MASENPWIQWAGGKCPVAEEAIVQVRHRNGDMCTDEAGEFGDLWADDAFCFDITAYRLAPGLSA
jgi:hypothetical protein